MTAFAIFNPASDGGRTGRNWARIEDALGSIFPALEAVPTRGPGQAAHLVRDALREGRLDIVAVGGDGTINEALNGFFDRGALVSREAVFSFVSTGDGRQGGDIARGFGIAPGVAAAVAHLRQSRIHRVDVGKVSCLSAAGVPVTRYFLGEASFGFSGAIATALARGRVARLWGRPFARRLHTLIQLLFWHDCRVRLMAPVIDGPGGFDEIAGIASVVLANGSSFGGLKVAPEASSRDGLFDLVVMAGGSRRRILRDLAGLKAGPGVSSLRRLRTARLTAAPTVDTEGPVLVETDGEGAGVLPATFEILPGALNVRL
jgi:diacylglycerol kinase family enzyme